MLSSARSRIYLLFGVGLLLLALVGALARPRLATIDSAIASQRPAYDTLAGLARIRDLVRAPPAAQSREAAAPSPGVGPSAAAGIRREVEGVEAALARIRTLVPPAVPRQADAAQPTARAPERDQLKRELAGLAAILSDDPAQRERLDRLGALAARWSEASSAGRDGDAKGVALDLSALLTTMESDANARLRGARASARASELAWIAFGASIVIAAVLVALLAAGLVRWEVAHRRRTTRRVARLIRRQRELIERLDDQATRDALTGLLNRKELLEVFARRIHSARAGGRHLAIIVADVNRLEHVNAMFGHEGGDEALKELAGRLRALCGEGDVAARLGGGGFAVLHACGLAPTDPASMAAKVQRSIAGDIRIGGQEFVLTSNAGFAVFPTHGDDARALLGAAELALTRARALGRNFVQPFDEALSTSSAEASALERRLCTALKKDEYLVHYQPYWGLESREVVGAEALLKWKRDGEGVLPASRFVPVLEETGMILDVGRWVLETTCGQIRDWAAVKRSVSVSVNLSVVQFRDVRLAGMVAEALGIFKLDPTHLTLEVTESTCLGDIDFAVRTLKTLKDMGVSISIDDFGTGYSSLSYLKRLPADSVKIDISFVRDVARDQDAASIITAITTLARGLNLKTIAEGVETEDQRKILHLLRCDMGQGFLFSPAVSAKEFAGLLSPEGGRAARA